LFALLCREFFWGGVVVLFAAYVAVVFFCGFEELAAAICGVDSDAFTQGVHLSLSHGAKASCDAQVLLTPTESIPLIVVATGKLIA
jgi:hypothetical protein